MITGETSGARRQEQRFMIIDSVVALSRLKKRKVRVSLT